MSNPVVPEAATDVIRDVLENELAKLTGELEWSYEQRSSLIASLAKVDAKIAEIGTRRYTIKKYLGDG